MPDPIAVWLADVDAAAALEPRARALLSAAELERADVYRFAPDRSRFTLTRAILRVLLGRTCNVAPTQLVFASNPAGRPYLRGADVAFNLSHSGSLAAIAIATVPVLGIDIERLALPPDAHGIARSFFATAECAALDGFAGAARERAFFRCWTRKESVLKATGQGISERALRELVVSVDESARVIQWAGEDAGAWQLLPLDLPVGYEGVVAVRGEVSGMTVQWCDVTELLRAAPGAAAEPGAGMLST